jgi:hypothetical protein
MKALRISAQTLIATFALCQMTVCSAYAQQANLLVGHVEQAGAQPLQAEISEENLPQSFPESYQGYWHCVTTVTDSGVPDVTAGTVTQCDIEFKKGNDGRILAHWSQPGWTESQTSVISFNNAEARLDRTAYYWADGGRGSWAARSRDQFTLTARNSIVSRSYVDQYVDGQYVGRYRTNSVLTKEDPPTPTIGMIPAFNPYKSNQYGF